MSFIPLILAIIVPFIWAFANVFDKYVLARKVKNTLSFTVVAGIVNLLLGIIIAMFLNWQMVSYSSLVFPILAGLFYAAEMFFYYYTLSKEDASLLVGFVYSYPIIVALLSFLFLNEIISFVGYLGMVLVILGIAMLVIRTKKMKLVIGAWTILALILLIALFEFFVKLSTTRIPGLNGVSVQIIIFGLTTLFALFHKNTRKGFFVELKNFKWASISEAVTLLAILFLFYAMTYLPATIVASLAATQPLAVLIYERIANKKFGKIVKDNLLLPKLGAIILIISGVILLSISTV
jgi:uncharacterized membrane protein